MAERIGCRSIYPLERVWYSGRRNSAVWPRDHEMSRFVLVVLKEKHAHFNDELRAKS